MVMEQPDLSQFRGWREGNQGKEERLEETFLLLFLILSKYKQPVLRSHYRFELVAMEGGLQVLRCCEGRKHICIVSLENC